MRKTFISQNITSPYSIQLFVTEGGLWEDPYPFKNVVRYATSASGHLSGEAMFFRIWPVADPNYLELRYTGGNEGTFSWESTEDGKSIINDGSTLCCPGGFDDLCHCNFTIYPPVDSSTTQTVELEVFLCGESEEFINLGTLCIIHDQNF